MRRRGGNDEGMRRLNGLLNKVIHEARIYFVEQGREKDSRRSHEVTTEVVKRLERVAAGKGLAAVLARQLIVNATYAGVMKEVGEILRALDKPINVKTGYGNRLVPTALSTVPRDEQGVPSGEEIFERVFDLSCEQIVDQIAPLERKRRTSASARWLFFAECERIARAYYGQGISLRDACQREDIDPRQMELKLNGTEGS